MVLVPYLDALIPLKIDCPACALPLALRMTGGDR